MEILYGNDFAGANFDGVDGHGETFRARAVREPRSRAQRATGVS